MKKALDQTVRDLKREVNKKVLKVSSIEQKTLDATSNEPCGPPGSYLAEIAQATYNFHDYQLIMTVVWRRIQGTGKNWRHVYKALNVLDYLIIYGSERVIDEIREHAYQISALSGFLYIDSNGKDQGSNIRSKSQSLVALVNNKGRLLEVRHKALFNRNKNHNISGSGESRPPLSSSTHYNDEHFEGLDDNREEGHLQERDMEFRDKVSSSNEGDDHTPHRVDAPPSYEEAVNGSWSHNQIEKDKDTKAASVQKASLTSLSIQPSSSDTIDSLDAGESVNAHEKNVHSFDEHDYRMTLSATSTAPLRDTELDIFGVSAVDFTASTEPTLETSTYTSEDNFANYSFGANFVVTPTICAVPSQPDANPFGDAPFKATPSSKEPAPGVVGEFSLAPPVFYASEYPAAHLGEDILDGLLPWTGTFDPVSFQETLPAAPSLNPFEPPAVLNHLAEQSNPFTCPFPSEINSLEKSGLTDPQISQGDPVFPHTFQCVNPYIIQPSAPVSAQASQPTTSDKQGAPSHKNPQANSAPPHANIPSIAPANYPGYQMNQQIKLSSSPPSQEVTVSAKVFQESAQSDGIQPPPFQTIHSAAPANSHGTQSNPTQASHIEVVPNQQSAHQLNHSKPPLISAPLSSDPSNVRSSQLDSSLPHDFFNQLTSERMDEFDPRLRRLSSPAAPQNTPFSIQGFTPQSSLVPSQASKKDFQPKSAVWADTISRGLVNLDLSASKANSLVHIGVDFDDINRKERRNDARSAHTTMTPATAMGKAMGAGSGLGRAGSSPFALPLNTPMGSNIGMAGPAIRGAYNPMNAGGSYGQQQPYGGEGGGDR